MSAVTIPILPSSDFDLTSGFWAGLGFAETGRWPGEYLIVRHHQLGIELHFWFDPSVDRWTNDVACYVRFDTPEAAVGCHGSWVGAPVPAPAVMSPPVAQPSGAVEFHMIDPHGNLVRFGGFPTNDSISDRIDDQFND
jgi:hypothetical protein